MMGVVVLQAYPVPQDKSAAQVTEFIQRRIINLGAIMVKNDTSSNQFEKKLGKQRSFTVSKPVFGSDYLKFEPQQGVALKIVIQLIANICG